MRTNQGSAIVSGDGDRQQTLVVIFLRGGADGLALVPPVGDAGYYDARPTLSIPEDDILKLGDSSCGLHPTMTGMHRLFEEGLLTVVPGAGSDDDTRSHFYAQDLMEHGGPVAGGWLGRFLRYREGPQPSALSAVALGKVMPEVLRGAPAATVMESLETFSLSGGGRSTESLQSELSVLYGQEKSTLGSVAKDTLQALDRIAGLKNDSPRNDASYNSDSFSRGLAQTAQTIRARVGLEVVSLDLGGWDSHLAQQALIEPLMRTLSEGLSAFRKDLGDLMSSVNVVVMSEFGRRVAENSSFGTDHGRGGAMFVMGGKKERGDVLGKIPELESGLLVGPGDVPVVTDYREVLKPILSEHGAGDSIKMIFPAS